MHSRHTLRFLTLLAFTGSIASLVGCGPGSAEVTGTVKINGKAPNVKGLEIVFLSGDGQSAAATVNLDGTYSATNVAVGEAKVSFAFLPNKAPEVQTKRNIGAPGSEKNAWKETPRNPVPVPLRDGSTSKLTFSVAPGGKNVFDYDIKP